VHPAGHFITTSVLTGAVFAGTQSIELAAGAFAGGFLIDLDHYFDYVAFNRQRDLRPSRFLEYYFKNQFDWVVLPLHSYELMLGLSVASYLAPHPLLAGYLIGATLHMALDLVFNESVIDRIVPFYSFIYRWKQGFAKTSLLKPEAIEEGP
jgi:hypothetical protein